VATTHRRVWWEWGGGDLLLDEICPQGVLRSTASGQNSGSYACSTMGDEVPTEEIRRQMRLLVRWRRHAGRAHSESSGRLSHATPCAARGVYSTAHRSSKQWV
jgi:hypothetical protein